MIYELATLSCPILSVGAVSEGARAWASEASAAGVLLGSWRTDIGTLGRLLLLRGFDTFEDVRRERERALMSADPSTGAAW